MSLHHRWSQPDSRATVRLILMCEPPWAKRPAVFASEIRGKTDAITCHDEFRGAGFGADPRHRRPEGKPSARSLPMAQIRTSWRRLREKRTPWKLGCRGAQILLSNIFQARFPVQAHHHPPRRWNRPKKKTTGAAVLLRFL